MTDAKGKMRSLFADMAGGAAGAALSIASADPTITMLAALSAPVCATLSSVAIDFLARSVSPSEKRRANKLFYAVMNRVWERRNSGEEIRSDGFFDIEDDRSPAQEVVEATVQKCIKEYQEKKLRFIAEILANALFSAHSAESVHSVLHLADVLSYRQFCLIRLLGDENTQPRVHSFYSRESIDHQNEAESEYLRNDLEQLFGRATGVATSDDGMPQLTPTGRLCFELMNLEEMEGTDLVGILGLMGVEESELPVVVRDLQ